MNVQGGLVQLVEAIEMIQRVILLTSVCYPKIYSLTTAFRKSSLILWVIINNLEYRRISCM